MSAAKQSSTSSVYTGHPEAIIVSSFFNPQKSRHRTNAFNVFYNSIKHVNHAIIEGVIGDAVPELPAKPGISHVHTPTLLWHKESLLNKAIRDLPAQFKYVFWVDADVLFTNKDWIPQSVEQL
jgi:hypothetical protein